MQLHCVLTRRVQLMAWDSRACSSTVVMIGAVDCWRAIMSANFSRSYVREMDSAKTRGEPARSNSPPRGVVGSVWLSPKKRSEHVNIRYEQHLPSARAPRLLKYK